MRKSYIAKGDEALNLHNGSQTAIVVKMKVQPKKAMWNTVKTHPKTDWCDEHGKPLFPPYTVGQDVYVREACIELYDTEDHPELPDCYIERWNLGYRYAPCNIEYIEHLLYVNGVREVAFTKYFSAVTMPKQAARTRFKIVGCDAVRVKELTVGNGIDLGCSAGNWGAARELIISKFGQSAWDNNDYIWYYKIEKI
jgi:hypothetical protein